MIMPKKKKVSQGTFLKEVGSTIPAVIRVPYFPQLSALGKIGFVPSDRITIGSIGLGRRFMFFIH